MKRLFFDTETSGFPRNDVAENSRDNAFIVQLAMLLYDDDQEISGVNILIQAEEREIHPAASRIHGISVAKSNDLGVSERIALDLFCGMATVADQLVCHNYNFDSKMIQLLMHRCGYIEHVQSMIDKPSYCTMLTTTDLCKIPHARWKNKYKWPKLTELHLHLFQEGFEGAHDALADIRATARCFFELQRRDLLVNWGPA